MTKGEKRVSENGRTGLGGRIEDSDGMEMVGDGRVRKGGDGWEMGKKG